MEGFTDLQNYDYMRLLTAVLAVFAAYRLAKLVRKDYQTYTTRLAEWVWFIFAVLFTTFVAMIEAVGKNGEYRYGSMLSFLIVCAALRASRSGPPLQK
jgi:NO-binding membrane sensor protein with MHYT domain